MKQHNARIMYLVFALFLFVMMPCSIHAETLQNYIDKVDKYTKELQEKKDQIATNDAEIAEIEEKVASIEAQMEKIKKEQEELQQKIKKNNAEIKSKEKETKELVRYEQISEGDNFYFDYVFGADSLTDMVYRMAMVEQITKYNDKVVDELNRLVKDNKKKKSELAKKDEELQKLTEELETEKKKLGEDSDRIREGMPSIEQQIKEAQKMVTFYKNKGCSPSDVIGVDCAVIPKAVPKPQMNSGNNAAGGNIASTGSFIRPIQIGYVTSGFGGRSFDDFHYGVDMSADDKYGTKVYPIAPGVIYHKGYDIYGALLVRIAHNYNGKIVGSTYVHLASFAPNIYEGMEVDTDDYIGIMGETGNAYGVHLHLEVSDCPYLYAGSDCYGWNSYITYLKNNWQDPAQYISFPSSWSVR